jgi:hypothetical protein
MSRWWAAGPHCRTDTGYWLELCAEVDWMFGHGMDTAEIAAALSVHEAVVSRALAQARAARPSGQAGGQAMPTQER